MARIPGPPVSMIFLWNFKDFRSHTIFKSIQQFKIQHLTFFDNQHSTINIQHSTFDNQHATINIRLCNFCNCFIYLDHIMFLLLKLERGRIFRHYFKVENNLYIETCYRFQFIDPMMYSLLKLERG